MPIASGFAIYFLFWWMCLFVVLPFGVRTTEEVKGERVPGQADSAPHQIDFRRIVLRTTIVSGVFFVLFLINYHFGWVTADMLDWTRW